MVVIQSPDSGSGNGRYQAPPHRAESPVSGISTGAALWPSTQKLRRRSAFLTPYPFHPSREVPPVTAPSWFPRANCTGEPISVFFPAAGDSLDRARMLCAGCSVRDECLAYALADPTLLGWWGGTSERERARMRRAAA